MINNKYIEMYLHISLQMLQLRKFREISSEYISICTGETFHFSSSYDSSQLNLQTYTILLNDTIVLPLSSKKGSLEEQSMALPNLISMQIWENHMILFEHEIDISEMKSRHTSSKKCEIRQGEILTMTLRVLQQQELSFGKRFMNNIAQHYLLINKIALNDLEKGSPDLGPSYFEISLPQKSIIIPVLNSTVIVQLPADSIQFLHIKNGKISSKSKTYSYSELDQEHMTVQLSKKGFGDCELILQLEWCINLYKNNKFQNNILMEAHQILLYDIQIKFQAQNYQYWTNSSVKIKIVYGNKAFQLNNNQGKEDVGNSKILKFARIVYFIIKSEEEEVHLIFQKGLKIIAQAVICTDQIIGYHLNTVKKKIIENTGKSIGVVKLKCEKAKNLSLPQNNAFWKACNSNKKYNQLMMLQFSQISLKRNDNLAYGIVIKTEKDELYIPSLNNFVFFKLETEIPQAVTLSLNSDENVYLKIVSDENDDWRRNQTAFIGISVINHKELRLGINCLTLPFYKNQEYTSELSLIINKVMPWPFIKSTFQPEIHSSTTSNSFQSKPFSVQVQLKKLQLTQYFYTYQYDNKSELYCIVQINKIKKVLILERLPTKTHKIIYVHDTNSSDNLHFLILSSKQEVIKIKITVLVSDSGIEEEIYGYGTIKLKNSQLEEENILEFNNFTLGNQFSVHVGDIDMEVSKGAQANNLGKNKSPYKHQLKNVQKDLDKINKSIEHVEKSLEKKNARQLSLKKYSLDVKNRNGFVKKGNLNTNDFKLPEIKSNKNDRVQNMVKMLQVQNKRVNNRKLQNKDEESVIKQPRIRTHVNNREQFQEENGNENNKRPDRYIKNINMSKNARESEYNDYSKNRVPLIKKNEKDQYYKPNDFYDFEGNQNEIVNESYGGGEEQRQQHRYQPEEDEVRNSQVEINVHAMNEFEENQFAEEHL